MAFDFSIDGIGVYAGSTGVGISINDLSGLGLNVDVDTPPGQEPDIGLGLPGLDGGTTAQSGPEGDLESLLGQSSLEPPTTTADTGDDAPPAVGTNGFDQDTLSSLTLLGGADDTAGLNGIDPLAEV